MKVTQSLLAAIGTIVMTASAFSQTSIVVIRNAEEMVAAADSMGIWTNPDGTTYHEPFCKIVPLEGGMFFVAAGSVKIGTSPYDLVKLVKGARREALNNGSGSFFKTHTFIDKAVLPEIDQSIEKMAHGTRNFKDALFNYILFGIENGELTMHLYRMYPARAVSWLGTPAKAESGMRKYYDSYECPGKCSGGLGYAELGQTQAIDSFVSAHPLPWKMDMADRAQFLVTLEIIDHPTSVGSPVDILRLKKDGTAKWIQRQSACDELEENELPPKSISPGSGTKRRPARKASAH